MLSKIVDAKLYKRLRKHADHFGVYITQTKTGVIELRCFARTHGGRDVKLLRVVASK